MNLEILFKQQNHPKLKPALRGRKSCDVDVKQNEEQYVNIASDDCSFL